ncbi:MAG TPA: aldo/keto reductase [Thermoanaerobaculia bacterium]|jgi:aryl-alcohol dehydrogenase-like predicted oxidoreductase|nr:aldo/keto reductase [Thermoanaerobaculia bacterium]
MDQTTLNNTADSVSAIGFGGMPLSIQGRPPEDQGRRVLHAAIDAGITFIDTADVYCLDDDDIGHNERLIASVLRERDDRDRIRVATKGGLRRPKGAWTNDGRPKHIREACEKSLRALETEQIFLYQYHAPDPSVPFEKSVEAFAELQRERKAKYVGLSNVSVKQIDAALKIVDVVSVQNRLNPFFRESLEDGVVAECERRRITFLAYSPVGGGRLAKKLPGHPVLQEIAREHGATTHAVTLAWVRSKGRTVVPIPGARTEEHTRDSARSIDLTLTPEEIAAIDDAEFSRA